MPSAVRAAFAACPLLLPAPILLGACGATLLLAVGADVLTLSQLHVSAIAAVSARLHARQVGLLRSLFRLFRGQRRNVLAGRTEPHDFDLAHNLAGTLLFCVGVLLAPTPLVFYAFFSALAAALGAATGACRAAVDAVNRAPVCEAACAAAGWSARGVQLAFVAADGASVGATDAHGGLSTSSAAPAARHEYFALLPQSVPLADVVDRWLDGGRMWNVAVGVAPGALLRRLLLGAA